MLLIEEAEQHDLSDDSDYAALPTTGNAPPAAIPLDPCESFVYLIIRAHYLYSPLSCFDS